MNYLREFSIKKWTQAEFKAARKAWTELLTSSNADPLFSSWEWQYTWWTKSHIPNGKLQLLAVYHGNQLVALAPLFTYKKYLKGFFPIIRCQFIGCSYEINDVNRSDNLDIIIRKNINKKTLLNVLNKAIISIKWDDFIIDGISRASNLFVLLRLKNNFFQIQLLGRYSNYIVRMEDSFEIYVNNLKKKIRQKTILHRKFIEPEVKVLDLPSEQFESFIFHMNRLKKQRWQKDIYANNRFLFHKTFIELCHTNKYLTPKLSLLVMNESVHSCFYGISTNEKIYFLQYAFNPDYNSKLSFGYIHLGYIIEGSFINNFNELQLLPGKGKHTNYKHRLANQSVSLLRLRLISSTWLHTLHIAKSYIKILKKKLNCKLF